jgi:hypothetical protein
MLELMTELDFRCFHCENSMSVTVKCEGKGLLAEDSPRAAVHVHCPTCNKANHVIFEPKGTYCQVFGYNKIFSKWEPSLN